VSREPASRGGRDATTAIDAEDVEDVVSTGALQAALRTVEALNARIAVSPAQAVVEIAKDVDRWGRAPWSRPTQ
jgi:hypothetical protein